MVALEHIFDLSIEPLDHAVGLGRSWWGQAVFSSPAQNLSNSCLSLGARLRRPKRRSVNSFPLAIVLGPMADLARSVNMVRMRIHCPAGHCNAMSREGTSTLQITQEATRIDCRLVVVDADEDPAGGPISVVLCIICMATGSIATNRYRRDVSFAIHCLAGEWLHSPGRCGGYFRSMWMYPGS
jgi:hypothetical protein